MKDRVGDLSVFYCKYDYHDHTPYFLDGQSTRLYRFSAPRLAAFRVNRQKASAAPWPFAQRHAKWYTRSGSYPHMVLEEGGMANGERCLLVHGHFYQPPRENPWTGQIDPQYSAAPWENWNRRIADECYIPMARSRLYNPDGEVEDLYNNYAHTSFNFGPTLLSWVERAHPELLRHLADATVIDRTFAMAQAYSHMMLPLADARDRHTQVLWGLHEFKHRFGFTPEGLWLSECGIDPETTRALIDHGIRFVILSPHQASKARPFGRQEWTDVSMGAIDTRRAYRLFDIDGGGRTHFDRHLDVVFYTPGLNLKVSFDHILNRPDDLKRELENCYRPDFTGAQLVSIVTDGEIYGHHEKRGEEALSRLYHDIAPALGLKVVSAGEFVRDNPPGWEVKLWNGDDNRGSSWSCQHGVGRWFRDCGCRPSTPPGWNQRWRGPVREAFDALRDRVRSVARRELGRLVWDVDDARNDYVKILLRPTPDERRDFLLRHAQRRLGPDEAGRLWRLLEALHNAMLMYASCGWFFDELSGLEPVQNMRYALRAAELIQEWHDEDLTALLEERLSLAESNIQHFGNGGKVFRELVLPSRHDNRELAAAMAACLAAGFPVRGLAWKLVRRTETVNYTDSDGNSLSWGSFVCWDDRLDLFIQTSWVARLEGLDNAGVALHGYEEIQGDPWRERGECPLNPNEDFSWLRHTDRQLKNMSRQELLERLGEIMVTHDRLPEVVRGMLYRRFSGAREEELLVEAAHLGTRAVPFLGRARKHGAQVPELVVRVVTSAFEQEMMQGVHGAIAAMSFEGADSAMVEKARQAAWELGVGPSLEACRRAVYLTGMELLHWLARMPEHGWFAALSPQDIPGTGPWLPPVSQANHDLGYPAASAIGLALGKGLAKLWEVLRLEDDPALAAVRVLPVPELLEFAERLALNPKDMVQLGIGYWDFLDKPVARLFRTGGQAIIDGGEGERLRRIGELLGFSAGTVDKRLRAAALA